MKTLKLIFTVVLLLFCSSCKRNTTTTANAPFLGYYVPNLSGWQGKNFTRSGSSLHTATFTRVENGAKSVFNFTIMPPGEGESPDGLVELRRFQNGVDKIITKTRPNVKLLAKKETTYQGYPAILTKTSDGKSKTTTIIVADGVNTLTLSKTIVSGPLTAESQQRTDAAWEELLKGIRIPHGSNKP